MRLKLDKVRERPFRWDEDLQIEAASLGHPDVRALGPVHWDGAVEHVDPGYLLKSSYRYRQTLDCRRCLEPVERDVEGEIVLLLVRETESSPPEELELEEEDLGVVHFQGEEIELLPFLEEEMQLNVPMKPLCRPDCQGLCPECGANWNDTSCDCETETTDPRWGGLADLKKQLEET